MGHLMPGARLAIHARHSERADAVATVARASGAFGEARASPSVGDAIAGAQVVLTMVSFGPARQQLLPVALDGARLVIAVDYDMSVPAATARGASRFVVDELAQFKATRETGVFVGYRDPDMTIGEALNTSEAAQAGPVLATHLGVGLADLIFADAILRRAADQGVGLELER